MSTILNGVNAQRERVPPPPSLPTSSHIPIPEAEPYHAGAGPSAIVRWPTDILRELRGGDGGGACYDWEEYRPDQ
ncbi:hypothetical protein GYMLUDRAFT_249347 [Collybiopsis luxurians FD-317 M1]|uniref:Uncharacterized protein n=1 Tax=Collybiopsis luxurians FD-317 M1 TaxID=944289 RepID=A0A0D0BIL2_9AGAR|nr:hypothetical protein GYMLUDRAFT_249347 [Collybiopsis luxurians FD-317 M1]